MSDRIQREVEELLKGMDALPPEKPLRRRILDAVAAPFHWVSDRIASANLPRFNAGHLLLFAIAVVVVWYVVGGDTLLWNLVIAAGIVLFIAAFVLSLRRHSKPPTRYWRDRPMDLDDRSRGRKGRR